MISIEFRDWINDKVLSYLPTDRQYSGDKVICRCPLCGDSKKNSMKKRGYYYLKTGTYYCFNCGESLTGMKLLERLSGSDYNELHDEYVRMMYDGKHFNSLSSATNLSPRFARNSLFNVKNIIKNDWKHELTDAAREYLNKRNVLKAPFLKENLYSYFDKKNQEYILIPWKMNGIDCYFQLNDFQKHNKMGMKYIFPKNRDKMIYGLDNIDISFNYILCFEGVYDSLFVKNGIAIGGKNLTTLQYDILKKRFPRHKICFALDNDIPGLTAVSKVINNKESSNEFGYFKWFNDDTKEKDINDYVNARNDVNIFTDKNYIENCIVDPVIMKMWLMKKGIS